jgi:glycosyltransferase involved in cell wall biosynthesis
VTRLRSFLSRFKRARQLRRVLKAGYDDTRVRSTDRAGADESATTSPSGPVVTPKGQRPRVVILADYPDWAQDRTAQAISRRLGDEFEFRIQYTRQSPNLSLWPFDLIYVLFWGEGYQRKFVDDHRKIIKQISSHRWETEKHWGRLTAGEAAYLYLRDAGTVTTPSRRLQTAFSPYREVLLAQKGFEPAEFMVRGQRTGSLRIGWAGDIKDPCKGLKDILRPAADSEFELHTASGDLSPGDMQDFYNSIDVICVASTAEGDPLTLLEGMACGCFPVAVDVGIVPELVRDGENGLIVSRDPPAFRAAFQWCAANVDFVREAGLRNAEEMLRTRTWDHVSDQWREALRRAYGKLEGQNPSA